MNYGYVYCLVNKDIPHKCKIGCVKAINRTSHDRAKELSSSTSCSMPFIVVFDIKVKNPLKYEKIIHKKLDKYRENKRREFFKCNPKDVIDYFKCDNLILTKDDKNDFPVNYFTEYDITKELNYYIKKQPPKIKPTKQIKPTKKIIPLKKKPIETIILPKKYVCMYCNKIYKHISSKTNHIMTHHKKEHVNAKLHKKINKIHSCSKCNTQFNSYSTKYRHEKICKVKPIVDDIDKIKLENEIYKKILNDIYKNI